MSVRPAVSVVVSTYRRAHRLPDLVRALERQTIQEPFEVVIVDNGSPDETSEILAELAARSRIPIRPQRIERNAGPAPARDLGWRAARAPLIAFTDDDCLPEPGWLTAMVAGLREHGVVQGRTEPNHAHRPQRGPFSRTQGIRAERGFYETCNMGYRRDVLERTGGFDLSFHFGGEDTDLGWRARKLGASSAFAHDAVVLHDITPSSFRAYLRSVRMWRGIVRVVRRHPELRSYYLPGPFWRWSHAYAFAALCGMATLAAGATRRSPTLAVIGALLGLPYVRYRMFVRPLPVSRKRRLLALPFLYLADLAELGLHVFSSIEVRVRSDPGPRSGGPREDGRVGEPVSAEEEARRETGGRPT